MENNLRILFNEDIKCVKVLLKDFLQVVALYNDSIVILQGACVVRHSDISHKLWPINEC